MSTRQDDREVKELRVATGKAEEIASAARPLPDVDRRIQRLQDLLVDALQNPDPLRANLRAATADLMEIGYRLGAGIKASLGSEPTSLDRFAEVMPAISSLALVHRQATRYVQFDREWTAGEDSGRSTGWKRPDTPNEAGEMEI
ncbi:MAG: hypothetical protein WCJ35_24750 [Planctomycetota bacterium]